MSTPTTNDETPKRRTWRQRRAEKFEALEAYIKDRESVRDQKAKDVAIRIAEEKREPLDWSFLIGSSHKPTPYIQIQGRTFRVTGVAIDDTRNVGLTVRLEEVYGPSYYAPHINKPSIAPIITGI